MNGSSPALDGRCLLLTALLWGSIALPGAAQGPAQQSAVSPEHAKMREIALEKHKAEQAKAKQDFWIKTLPEENKTLEQDSKYALKLGGKIAPEESAAMVELLKARIEPLQELLKTETGSSTESAAKAWDKLAELRRLNADAAVDLYKVNEDRFGAEQWAKLLNIDKSQFWGLGALAIATLLCLILYDRRHEVRRRFLGSRARSMGLFRLLGVVLLLLIGLTAAVYFKGDEIYRSLTKAGAGSQPPWITEQDELATLKAQEKKLEQDHLSKREEHDRILKEWKERQPNEELASQIAQYRKQLLDLRLQKSLSDIARKQYQAASTDYKDKQEKLKADQSRLNRSVQTRDWIKCLLGLTLLGLTVGGGFWFVAGVQRRKEKIANTCPMCMSLNTLESVTVAGRYKIEQLRCRNVITQDPYQECDFTFNAVYREMTKICFPTLGVPSSGKTFWTAMVYRKLTQNPPEGVRFAPVESRATEDLLRIIEEIIQQRVDPAATQTGSIPPPLVFDFSDQDKPPFNLLINLFDYAGEITQGRNITDEHRQRALDGDGFLFFLDPTYPADPQAKALVRFREDLRVLKGLKPHQKLRAPIALCVSKLDLLAHPDCPASSSIADVNDFYAQLQKIDPTGERCDLETILKRSEAMADMRQLIWGSWDIANVIQNLFGGRFMYFPMTPVGLDQPGVRDLTNRNINPLYILEPLMWLMHMNGYKVFR